MSKVAIVLMNLGGPDSPSAVKPFLFNLFNDPAIIGAPAPIRYLIAKLISSRRKKKAQGIYAHIGGRSPIVPNTEVQARALEAALGPDVKCFIAMRYWHPRAQEVVAQLSAYQPDHLILLPLYPQFSTTTSESSLLELHQEAIKQKGWLAQNWQALKVETLCCYPTNDGFIDAQVALIRPQLEAAAAFGKPRLLLSAHGLPKKVIAGGDPYQSHCEATARAIVQKLNWPELDWLNCYQSRVGPLEWIGPSTDAEIERAGKDGVPVVLSPIAFVSEHSETLVELDIEYKELAHEHSVPFYGRVPTVDAHPRFIEGLATMVRARLSQPLGVAPDCGERICEAGSTRCICGKDIFNGSV
jgi:ferrochelatase